MKEKNHYFAWVINDQGASTSAGHSSSINDLAKRVRREFGSGWTVHIERVEINGEHVEVQKFTIRESSAAASALGRMTSDKKKLSSAANGKRGGRGHKANPA